MTTAEAQRKMAKALAHYENPTNFAKFGIIVAMKYDAPAVLEAPRRATQEVSAPMRDQSTPTLNRICERCGSEFVVQWPSSPNRFCSLSCSARHHTEARRAKRRPVDNGDGTATVTLTRGMVAIIDAADIEMVARHTWCASGKIRTYAICRRAGLMHRYLMDAPDGVEVDHINGNKLDNRRANLRFCSRAENQWNVVSSVSGNAGYIGVYRHPNGRYYAKLINRGERVWLGGFDTADGAARAYDDAVARLRGEFARTNEGEAQK